MEQVENLIKYHIDRLDGVSIAYQHSDFHDLHLLEIFPAEKLEDDEVFNVIQDLIDEAVKADPCDLWFVTSPNSFLQVTEPSFTYSSRNKVAVNA